MAEKYLSSTKVKVFPSAYRGKDSNGKLFDPESRLNTEKNLVKLATKIASKDSFVITKDFELGTSDTNKKLEFCIKGYWFELTLSYSDLSSLGPDIYAEIKVEAKNTPADPSANVDYEALSLSPFGTGQTVLDSGGNFIGLKLTDGTNGLYLLTFDDSTNTYFVPFESRFALDASAIEDELNSGIPMSEEVHTGDIWLDNQKPSGNSNGLTINTSGRVMKKDFSNHTIVTDNTGNAYSYVDTLSQNKIGEVTVTTKTIPDASATTKGLVTAGDQTFGGSKTFNGDVYVNTIKSAAQYVTINSYNSIQMTVDEGDIDISTSGDINLNVTRSGDTVNYNGEEIATYNKMRTDSNKGISYYAKKIGEEVYGGGFQAFTLGEYCTPLYLYNGEFKPVRWSTINASRDNSNAKVYYHDLGTESSGPTNDNLPATFSYSVNTNYSIDNIVLHGSVYNSPSISDSESVKGAVSLSFDIIRSTTSVKSSQWLKIDLNELLKYMSLPQVKNLTTNSYYNVGVIARSVTAQWIGYSMKSNYNLNKELYLSGVSGANVIYIGICNPNQFDFKSTNNIPVKIHVSIDGYASLLSSYN